MSSAKALAQKFESLAKANEPPPPPVHAAKSPSAKSLAMKFERMAAGAPVPSPAAKPVFGAGGGAVNSEKRVDNASTVPTQKATSLPPAPAAAPPPAPITLPTALSSPPSNPPAGVVPIAPVTFAANAPPRSAPPPPSHGTLVPSSPPPAGGGGNGDGNVFPRGQSAAAVAARSRALQSDDEDDDDADDDDERRNHAPTPPAPPSPSATVTAAAAPSPSPVAIPAAFSGADVPAAVSIPGPAEGGSVAGGVPSTTINTTSSSPAMKFPAKSFGATAPKCPKCNKSVYFAERVVGLGNVDWHKACLRCEDCNRTLTSVADITDHKGQLFCKVCYAKNFGPKGCGFAGGGTMFHTQ